MKNNINKQFELVFKKIQKSKNIYIISHIQPDGDNVGSILALGMAIKMINNNVFIIKTDEISSDFLFLPKVDMIEKYNNENEIDLLITLDTSDVDRLGKNKKLISKAKTVINIDHHISNTNFGHINIVNPIAGATGELVYDLIKAMEIPINKDIATCIYTAISSDTGSFKYDNTTDKTHEIAAELLRLGIDKNEININLYQNRSIERTLLFIKTLQNIDFLFNNKVALVKVSQKMLEESNAKIDDTEGIVSFIKEIAPVEVAVLLKELTNDEIKISMRSKKLIDVSKICSNFGGGGHIRASGCTIITSLSNAEELIINELKKVF